MKIMDYSLLVGIHYKSRSREKGLRRRSVQLSPDAKWVSHACTARPLFRAARLQGVVPAMSAAHQH